MASPVNLRSGLQAVGALRPVESNSQQPVAFETAVVATGARPGDSAAKRELFTEETQTVLVFENGAVIRLSAAVADGQLLFLTNKTTGKEVVTQVLRKRSFRPTNCYVDLEFTEPCPNFWGIEFRKSAVPTVPASASKTRTDAGDSAIALAKPETPPNLRPPNVQEVERLKQEVSQLQTQLKFFTESTPVQGAAAADPLAGPVVTKVAGKIGAEVTRKEEERRLEELFALEAKQEAAHSPKRLVAYPKKSGTRGSQKIASKKWLLAATLAAMLCLALAYDFGAFGSSPIKPAAPKSATTLSLASGPVAVKASQNTFTASRDTPKTPAAAPPIATILPAKSSPVMATDNKSERAVPTPSANSGAEIPSAAIPINAAAPNLRRTADKPSASGRIAAAANNSAPSPSASLNPEATFAASTTEAGAFVLPKLLHAVKPVAPPEALKNYVTGTVNVDALVDTKGHIKSVTILSGPAKLRQHAIEEMKQYVYEPAKRNGIAVNAHVQVSLQYWYEP